MDNLKKDSFDDKMFDVMLTLACDESLKNDIENIPDEEDINISFSHEFNKRMNKEILNFTKPLKKKAFRKLQKRVAIIVLGILSVGFAYTMSISAVRVQVINTIYQIAENHLKISFYDKPEDLESVIRPDTIPVGFRFDSEMSMPGFSKLIYINDNGVKIYFDTSLKTEALVINIDNEHAIPYEYTVNGQKLTVLDGTPQGYPCMVYWEDEEYFYKLYGEYSAEEIIIMAKSAIK